MQSHIGIQKNGAESLGSILVVDDSASVASHICQKLGSVVSEVSVVSTGWEAIEWLNANAASLVLLDYSLPDMTGMDVLKVLADRGLTIPFVTITGHGDEKIAVEMMKLGAHDYLVKDETFLDLLPSVVKRVLGQLATEKKLKVTEKNLAEEQNRYRELVDNLSSGVAVYAPRAKENDFVFVDINRAAGQIDGMERERVIGKSIGEVFPGIEDFGLLDVFRRVWKTGQSEYFPPTYYQDERVSGWREHHVYKLPSGEIVAIYDDVTARKQGEDALRESEQKYKSLYNEFQTLLNGIPSFLSLVSPELKVIWVNSSLAAFCNKEVDEVANRCCYELWKGRREPCEECPVLACFHSGAPQEALKRQNGKVYGVKTFPLKDETGTVISVIHMADDITEKVLLREEAQRNSRLASLGELAAGIAHEINNPNGLILLDAPVLEEVWAAAIPLLDERYRERGDFMMGKLKYSRVRSEIPRLHGGIIDSARRIKTIVDDLKDFVSQEIHDCHQVVDLNEVVRVAVRLVANTIKNSTGNFKISYDDELPRIRGIFQRLEQVVINLLINACQALPDASRGIFVSTAYDAEKNMAILIVRDEGTGIDPENLPHLTDPFFTTRRNMGGTGLGLSVSARIVNEHGGHMDFVSTLGAGTTASLALPVCLEMDP